MKKIAITLSTTDTQHVVNQKYIDHIMGSGYIPILIPQMELTDNNMQFIRGFAKDCDGLVLPGGIDLEPTHYGEVNYGSQNCDPDKDDFERAVLYSFADEKKPIFGICRGFQLIVREFIINAPKEVSKFLDFEQHIANHNQGALAAKRSTPTHSVRAFVHILYNVKGAGEGLAPMFVNSMHHQALRITSIPEFMKLGSPLRPLAITDHGLNNAGKNKSAIVEAFDIENFMGSRVRAVQWHPEEMRDTTLLASFFETAIDNKNVGLNKNIGQ